MQYTCKRNSSHGTIDSIEYMIDEDILYYNGKIIESESETRINSCQLNMPLRSSGSWICYYTIEGKINVTNMTIAAAGAAIATKVGTKVGLQIINAALVAYYGENWNAKYVSYKIEHYYWDPIVTSRPRTKQIIYLYEGKNFDNLIATF